MKIQTLRFASGLLLFSAAIFSSCKKINQATELGGKLVPAADNVHTFEVALNAISKNVLFNDTTKVLYTDLVAVGDINDPEFGHTHANTDFNISPSSFGAYPFVKTDSLAIDSVILSLSYVDAYGDTTNNGVQTLRVYEIAQNSGFHDTTLYKYSDPASDFATTGPELGSATFTIKHLKDSVVLVRGKDTSYVSNVVRIKLDNSLGYRFAQYDTTNGYKNDSIFHSLFAGFSVKADPAGNALSYYRLSDINNTKLTVYFRYGKSDTSSFDYHHVINGQSNYVNREIGGNYLAYLNNGASDRIYLQSAPGSYVSISIPGLDTFSNKTIHRAEIFAERIPSGSDDVFTAPIQLMLDRKNKSGDTAFMLQNDLVADPGGSVLYAPFGGKLLSDNTIRFNISRYVQSIITRHEPNDTLRMYAPLRTNLFNLNFNTYLSVPAIDAIAKGRLVLGGGTYADSSIRLKLRIIYSNL